jgi:hypothetical protein
MGTEAFFAVTWLLVCVEDSWPTRIVESKIKLKMAQDDFIRGDSLACGWKRNNEPGRRLRMGDI